MIANNIKSAVFFLFFCLCINFGAFSPDYSIPVSKIKVLTLNHGRLTSNRRSQAIPQLKCVGGTAGCSAFVPQVVQCKNQGFDGITIQWECKTDMDNAYRFGKIAVICEGYDYPSDHNVLVGSCGMEYYIDLTKEGIDKKPHIPISDVRPPSSNDHGTSTAELSSLSIFFICLGVLVFATAIFGLIAYCLVDCRRRSGSYDMESSRLYDDYDGPFARPVPYTIYRPRTIQPSPIYRPTTVHVSSMPRPIYRPTTVHVSSMPPSSSGTRIASGFGGTMSR